MFVNSHIASGYLAGIFAKQDRKWTIWLIFATILPDIDGLWSNTVAGHHSILHTPIFWIVLCGLGWGYGKVQSKDLIQKASIILFLGALLHLTTDWLTSRTVGIQWFYPISETNYWIYPIEPKKGNIPIWDMVIPPYINFYFENKILVYSEILVNFVALGWAGKTYFNKKSKKPNKIKMD